MKSSWGELKFFSIFFYESFSGLLETGNSWNFFRTNFTLLLTVVFCLRSSFAFLTYFLATERSGKMKVAERKRFFGEFSQLRKSNKERWLNKISVSHFSLVQQNENENWKWRTTRVKVETPKNLHSMQSENGNENVNWKFLFIYFLKLWCRFHFHCHEKFFSTFSVLFARRLTIKILMAINSSTLS